MPDPAPALGLPVRLWRLLAAQCAVVLACVGVTTAVALDAQERGVRAATEERVLQVAESLADLDAVQRAVLLPREQAMAELQPLADLLGAAGGVDYVAIADVDGTRLAHPSPAERGLPLSTDPGPALEGEVFVGVEEGTLGRTLRAKVPIRELGASGSSARVVGVASVGIGEARLREATRDAAGALVPWVVAALLGGFVLSGAITGVVARRMRPLEEGVRELEAQRRVTEALRDQAHEFRTRLHAVRGLVAEDEREAALAYIGGLVPVADGATAPEELADPALRALLAGLVAEAAAAGGALAVDAASAAPAGVLDDDDLDVVANLARNAIESRPGASARVLVAVDAAEVQVQVDDDGPGIPAARVARVLERGVSGKGPGRGLGLHRVATVVRRRGGTIEVGASPEGGARLLVEMPAAPR